MFSIRSEVIRYLLMNYRKVSTDISPFFFPLLFYLGLYPEDTLEAAFADAAVDAVGDNQMKLAPTVQEKDMTKKVRFGSTVSLARALVDHSYIPVSWYCAVVYSTTVVLEEFYR